ncbi:MAG: TSUP family transporter [Nitriliruptoraceae bacterium]
MAETTLVALAVLVGALIKGLTGLGLPPVALALLVPLLGAEHAVVILALPTVVSNSWLVAAHWRSLREADNLFVVAATGVVGALVGARLLVWLDESAVAIGLGVVVLTYAVLYVAKPDAVLSPRAARVLAAPAGLGAGMLQGATGLSAPVLGTYLHARRLPRSVYLASIALLFQIFALTQLIGVASFGLLDLERLVHTAAAAGAALVGVPTGMRVGRELGQRRFEQVTLAVLVLSTLTLVLEAFGIGPW